MLINNQLRLSITYLALALFSAPMASAEAVSTSMSKLEVQPKAQAETQISPEIFAQCIERFKAEASKRQISEGVINTDLAKVSISPRVLELDRQQPEFTSTFADYLNKRVTLARVEKGRKLLREHSVLLNKVADRYGISPPYLLAFWGLETNFGGYLGRMSTLNSLATLGCDERRSTYFTGELMAALTLIDEGSVTSDLLKGSWAGAMGHVQFMPSTYLRYAVDYDGDGKRDLWGSLPDAMASAANLLAALDWNKGERWGREVSLPKDFAYLEAGLNNRRTLGAWRKLGVRNADGSALPQADMEAALLIPAGHKGPAFLVYHNFDVIMGWNKSEFYAIAIGYMANRIAGMGKILTPPPEDAPHLHRDDVIQLQQRLVEDGFSDETPDGILGPQTRLAIRKFQAKNGLIADGFPSQTVLAALGVSLSPRE
ncbi:MAG: membrane-bound lytic murein transglycosylase B [Lentisphaeria bacterium]|jgi:membrane-bound lytic murein transglycosylase B